MSGVEVVACVAGVVTAFESGAKLVKYFKEKRRLKQAQRFQHEELQQALMRGNHDVSIRHTNCLREFGTTYGDGPSILARIVDGIGTQTNCKLEAMAFYSMVKIRSDMDAMLTFLEYLQQQGLPLNDPRSSRERAEESRWGMVRSLDEMRLRLRQAHYGLPQSLQALHAPPPGTRRSLSDEMTFLNLSNNDDYPLPPLGHVHTLPQDYASQDQALRPPPLQYSQHLPYQQPSSQSLAHQQPSHQQPSHQQPSHQQPSHQQPSYQQPSRQQQLRQHYQPTEPPPSASQTPQYLAQRSAHASSYRYDRPDESPDMVSNPAFYDPMLSHTAVSDVHHEPVADALSLSLTFNGWSSPSTDQISSNFPPRVDSTYLSTGPVRDSIVSQSTTSSSEKSSNLVAPGTPQSNTAATSPGIPVARTMSDPLQKSLKLIRSDTIQGGPRQSVKGIPSKQNDYHGFCKGSWQVQESLEHGLEVARRPVGAASFIFLTQCKQCKFVGRSLDKKRIVPDSRLCTADCGVRYRWTFLAMSHKKRKAHADHTVLDKEIMSSSYGCLFCYHEGLLSDNYGSVDSLMRHIVHEHGRRSPAADSTMRKIGAVLGEPLDSSANYVIIISDTP